MVIHTVFEVSEPDSVVPVTLRRKGQGGQYSGATRRWTYSHLTRKREANRGGDA